MARRTPADSAYDRALLRLDQRSHLFDEVEEHNDLADDDTHEGDDDYSRARESFAVSDAAVAEWPPVPRMSTPRMAHGELRGL
jgi:hypothetical protein